MDDHSPLDLIGFSTTQVVPPPANAVGASQAAVVATAATIDITLHVTFDSINLPVDARARYDTFNIPIDILTQKAMVTFAQPTGVCGPVLFYLDPPLGAGVIPTPTDSNRIITQNGQFSPLVDQGNDGLKKFLNNIPPCHGTSLQAVQL